MRSLALALLVAAPACKSPAPVTYAGQAKFDVSTAKEPSYHRLLGTVGTDLQSVHGDRGRAASPQAKPDSILEFHYDDGGLVCISQHATGPWDTMWNTTWAKYQARWEEAASQFKLAVAAYDRLDDLPDTAAFPEPTETHFTVVDGGVRTPKITDVGYERYKEWYLDAMWCTEGPAVTATTRYLTVTASSPTKKVPSVYVWQIEGTPEERHK